MRVDQIFNDSASRFYSESNQAIAVGPESVAALVQDYTNDKLFIVTYQEGDNQLTTIAS